MTTQKLPTILLAAALFLTACAEQTPVKYKIWYDWPERVLPEDFATLGEPDLQGAWTNIDLRGVDDMMDHYAMLLEAPLKVDAEEEYSFTLTTDDGSRFSQPQLPDFLEHFGVATHVQFIVDVLLVVDDGAGAEEEFLGDLLVRQAFFAQGDDLALPV